VKDSKINEIPGTFGEGPVQFNIIANNNVTLVD